MRLQTPLHKAGPVAHKLNKSDSRKKGENAKKTWEKHLNVNGNRINIKERKPKPLHAHLKGPEKKKAQEQKAYLKKIGRKERNKLGKQFKNQEKWRTTIAFILMLAGASVCGVAAKCTQNQSQRNGQREKNSKDQRLASPSPHALKPSGTQPITNGNGFLQLPTALITKTLTITALVKGEKKPRAAIAALGLPLANALPTTPQITTLDEVMGVLDGPQSDAEKLDTLTHMDALTIANNAVKSFFCKFIDNSQKILPILKEMKEMSTEYNDSNNTPQTNATAPTENVDPQCHSETVITNIRKVQEKFNDSLTRLRQQFTTLMSSTSATDGTSKPGTSADQTPSSSAQSSTALEKTSSEEFTTSAPGGTSSEEPATSSAAPTTPAPDGNSSEEPATPAPDGNSSDQSSTALEKTSSEEFTTSAPGGTSSEKPETSTALDETSAAPTTPAPDETSSEEFTTSAPGGTSSALIDSSTLATEGTSPAQSSTAATDGTSKPGTSRAQSSTALDETSAAEAGRTSTEALTTPEPEAKGTSSAQSSSSATDGTSKPGTSAAPITSSLQTSELDETSAVALTTSAPDGTSSGQPLTEAPLLLESIRTLDELRSVLLGNQRSSEKLEELRHLDVNKIANSELENPLCEYIDDSKKMTMLLKEMKAMAIEYAQTNIPPTTKATAPTENLDQQCHSQTVIDTIEAVQQQFNALLTDVRQQLTTMIATSAEPYTTSGLKLTSPYSSEETPPPNDYAPGSGSGYNGGGSGSGYNGIGSGSGYDGIGSGSGYAADSSAITETNAPSIIDQLEELITSSTASDGTSAEEAGGTSSPHSNLHEKTPPPIDSSSAQSSSALDKTSAAEAGGASSVQSSTASPGETSSEPERTSSAQPPSSSAKANGQTSTEAFTTLEPEANGTSSAQPSSTSASFTSAAEAGGTSAEETPPPIDSSSAQSSSTEASFTSAAEAGGTSPDQTPASADQSSTALDETSAAPTTPAPGTSTQTSTALEKTSTALDETSAAEAGGTSSAEANGRTSTKEPETSAQGKTSSAQSSTAAPGETSILENNPTRNYLAAASSPESKTMTKDGLVYGPVGGIAGLATLLILLQRRKAMQKTQMSEKPLKKKEIHIRDSMDLERTPEIRKHAVAIKSDHLNLEEGEIAGDSLSNSNDTSNSELSFNDEIASPPIEVLSSSEGSSSEDSSNKQKKNATQRRLNLKTTHVHESEIPKLVSNTSASHKITTPSVFETSNKGGSEKSIDTSPIGRVEKLRAVYEK